LRLVFVGLNRCLLAEEGMDTDLLKLAQNGDKGAFTTLAAARADRFLAASHRILRDFSLAEDATQQALLSSWDAGRALLRRRFHVRL
jgi:DNA-directed RNA polymerase specialized sigma24 family protein